MFDPNNPTAGLRLPKPLSAKQLAALRPQPVGVTEITLADAAKSLAYRSGIKELEPLFLRIAELEQKVLQLQNDILEVKYPQPHLRGVEKRKA